MKAVSFKTGLFRTIKKNVKSTAKSVIRRVKQGVYADYNRYRRDYGAVGGMLHKTFAAVGRGVRAFRLGGSSSGVHSKKSVKNPPIKGSPGYIKYPLVTKKKRGGWYMRKLKFKNIKKFHF